MKKLPIGIQSFEKIRTDAFYYVDKTAFVKRLADSSGGYFFLSRPRRFGKSLFLDTLRQAFLGKQEFFEGLYLENHWDWSRQHPVILISFGSGVVRSLKELQLSEKEILRRYAERFDITLKAKTIKDRLYELIEIVTQKFSSKIVVLIDEYDKPILDNIERPDLALELREELKNLYSVLKDADEFLRFVFVTGVTKFSKVSLFSGLNQLQDITLNPEYATICGYTQGEFEDVFKERLGEADLTKIKRWYNGYSWLGEPVYNPFDVLLHLAEREFRPYWFETGNPSFLIRLLTKERYLLPTLEEMEVGEELLGAFDVDSIYPETLLFQAGYLTIKGKESQEGGNIYRLGFPNQEVRVSLNSHLLNYLVKDYIKKERNRVEFIKAVRSNDFDRIRRVLQSFFSSIPYDWYRKNAIAGYEGYYASVVYAYFAASGFDVVVENATSKGKIDMAVSYGDRVYIIEFKVVELESKGTALEQIKKRRYWKPFLEKARDIYLIGVEFSKEERNIVGFEWEKVK